CSLVTQPRPPFSAASPYTTLFRSVLIARALTTTTGNIFASAGGDASFTTANVTATTGSDAITLKSTGGALSLDSATAQGAITLEARENPPLNPNRPANSPGRHRLV